MGATSQEAINREKRARRIALIASVAIVVIIIGLLGYLYWSRFQIIFRKKAQLAELQQEKERLQRKIAQLKQKLKHKNDPSYIRQLARSKLGLRQPT